MNPNREHIDDEVTVNEGAVAEFKTWLTRPPRRARRDMVIVPVALVFAVVWFALFIGSASVGAYPGVGIVLAGVSWAVAECMPVRAARAVISLRLAGAVLFVVSLVAALVLPIAGGP